jgi:hypothetical protein
VALLGFAVDAASPGDEIAGMQAAVSSNAVISAMSALPGTIAVIRARATDMHILRLGGI